MHRVRALTALAAMLLLAGCTADGSATEEEDPPPIGGEEPDDTDGSDPSDEGESESSQEGEDDPYAVPEDPDEIDEDYAERVINALLEIDTEALVIALEQEPHEVLAVEAAERIAAIAAGEHLADSLEDFQEFVRTPESREGLRPADEITPTEIEVDAILHAEPERCVLVAGWWNRKGSATDPPPDDIKSVFSLSRIDPQDASERNPTPWAIREIARLSSAEGDPIPQDRWDDIDFGDNLDRTCEDR